MNVQRMISAAALAAVALCVYAPAAGASSTLLSGYGGPGQGNQAIIGSSLVGGGGGAGGSGTSVPSSSSSSSSSIAVPQTQSVGPSTGAPKPRPKRHTPGHAGAGAAGSAAKSTPPKVAVTALSADRGGGRTLGLSGADLAYIILALAALAVTALLTVLLTRRTGGAEGAQ